jgi:hypothetical protein
MEKEQNSNDWLTKDRSETHSNRMPDRLTPNGVSVSNLALGINVYNNAISEDNCKKAIETLELKLTDSTHHMYRWSPAMVTESDSALSDARDCVDFKISSTSHGPTDS